MVGGGAGHKLLLREREELACGNEVSTFNTAGGREGPAGAALTLIFHRGYGALSDPVDGGSVGLWEDLDVSAHAGLSWFFTKHLFVFCAAPVRELVVAGGPSGVGGGVVLLDELVGQIEVGHALAELLDRVYLLAERREVVHVGKLGGGESGGNASEGGNGKGFHVKGFY